MTTAHNDDERGGILTSTEVAERFRVDQSTVRGWATRGSINSWKTPGGHLRFYERDVAAFRPDQDAEQ